MNDYNMPANATQETNGTDLKEAMLALLRKDLAVRPSEPATEAPKPAPKKAADFSFKLGKAAENAKVTLTPDILEKLNAFLGIEAMKKFVPNARFAICPEGSPFLRVRYEGEEKIEGENGVFAIVRKNQNEQVYINLFCPTIEFPHQAELERERTMARLTSKVKMALEYFHVEACPENVEMVLNFMMTNEKMLEAVKISFWSEGCYRLRPHEGEECTRFEGENGMHAILSKDRHEVPILNVCIPAFNAALRVHEYPSKLRQALADWVIAMKHLQVRGYSINREMDSTKEIEADKDYLKMVLDRIMNSDVVKSIIQVVAAHPEYLNIRVYPFKRTKTQEGKMESLPLFHIEPLAYAKEMAKEFEGEYCVDLIQGNLEKLSQYGMNLAIFNTQLPSCYLSKVMRWNPENGENEFTGSYHLNIYIPAKEMEMFLDVNIPNENTPEEASASEGE